MPNRTFLLTEGLTTDGDLYGLVPARQALPGSPHILVDGTSVRTYQDWTGLDGVTVLEGLYTAGNGRSALAMAARIARVIHDNLNPTLDGAVIHSTSPTEGAVVLIGVAPGNYAQGALTFNGNTTNYGILQDGPNIWWQDGQGTTGNHSGLPASAGRVVRDICYLGLGADVGDVLFPRTAFGFSPNQSNDSYPGQVDNVRFENVTFYNEAEVSATISAGVNIGDFVGDPDYPGGVGNGQAFYHADRDPDDALDGAIGSVWRNRLTDDWFWKNATAWELRPNKFTVDYPRDAYQGVVKIYDAHIRGKEGVTSFQGTGQRWPVRGQAYATGWDFRNVEFWAAEEHSWYIDNPQAFIYTVNCRQRTVPLQSAEGPRLGNGRTTFQQASRLIRHCGTAAGADARVVFIRCLFQGNLETHGDGGFDYTHYGGFDGEIHMIDCDWLGTAVPWSSPTAGDARGLVNIDIETGTDRDTNPQYWPKGGSLFESAPFARDWYSTRKFVLRLATFRTVGNNRSTVGISACKEVEVDFDEFQSSSAYAQIEMNRETAGGRIPYTPNRSFLWGAAQANPPSSSPPFLAGDGSSPPHGNATRKMEHNRVSDGATVLLTDAQIDAYDGSDPE